MPGQMRCRRMKWHSSQRNSNGKNYNMTVESMAYIVDAVKAGFYVDAIIDL